jgi:hypothetical protein
VFLARVPLTLPLESPLPRQAAVCLPLQEAIEQRAAAFGVPVDARVQRGRTYRHALRQTFATEHFERIVMAAATDGGPGFGPDDVAWLMATAPSEIIVLRPSAEHQLVPSRSRSRRANFWTLPVEVSGAGRTRSRRRTCSEQAAGGRTR